MIKLFYSAVQQTNKGLTVYEAFMQTAVSPFLLIPTAVGLMSGETTRLHAALSQTARLKSFYTESHYGSGLTYLSESLVKPGYRGRRTARYSFWGLQSVGYVRPCIVEANRASSVNSRLIV